MLDVSVALVHFPNKSRFFPKTQELRDAGEACKPKCVLSSRSSPLSVCCDARDGNSKHASNGSLFRVPSTFGLLFTQFVFNIQFLLQK